ncbi:MAG TPA: RsmE family RNA methyltransferase [Bryobacteraceae bacterium]|jgi:16S rRNA (uracil1498-N3)-methyltransferase|nr:RsmE family RNA methyltransferase [Bryobacteraceae bacterium]
MSRRRFFVSEVRRGTAELTGAEAEHLVRVLRAEAGQVYELSDNQRVYLAQIESARKSLVCFRILEELALPAATVRVILLPAIFKFDRFEWLVEKATELGVDAIQPWEAVRSEKGLAQAAAKRIERWRKIAIEASQQARRARLPEVRSVSSLRDALQTGAQYKLLLDEDSGAPPIVSCLRAHAESVSLILGPEGGWTPAEKEQAIAAGWQPCSLGNTILRAETAAIAALAVVRAFAAANPSHCNPSSFNPAPSL